MVWAVFLQQAKTTTPCEFPSRIFPWSKAPREQLLVRRLQRHSLNLTNGRAFCLGNPSSKQKEPLSTVSPVYMSGPSKMPVVYWNLLRLLFLFNLIRRVTSLHRLKRTLFNDLRLRKTLRVNTMHIRSTIHTGKCVDNIPPFAETTTNHIDGLRQTSFTRLQKVIWHLWSYVLNMRHDVTCSWHGHD